MAKAFLLLGGNIGDVSASFRQCVAQLQKEGFNILNQSSDYKTEAWGYDSDNSYLNKVLVIETDLAPISLLEQLLEIEKLLGRTRNGNGYTDRIIDIDILLYADEVVQTEQLEVPHPRMHLRKFALAPLAEVDPLIIHPVLNKNIGTLLEECPDHTLVEKI